MKLYLIVKDRVRYLINFLVTTYNELKFWTLKLELCVLKNYQIHLLCFKNLQNLKNIEHYLQCDALSFI